MSRANGCDVSDVAWVWALVYAVALAVAAVAARMLARTVRPARGYPDDGGDDPTLVATRSTWLASPASRSSSPASAAITDALTIVVPTWLLRQWPLRQWLSFNRGPWWFVHCAHVRELPLVGNAPQVLR